MDTLVDDGTAAFRKTRLVVGSILAGSTVCLLLSKVNTGLYRVSGREVRLSELGLEPLSEERLLSFLRIYKNSV